MLLERATKGVWMPISILRVDPHCMHWWPLLYLLNPDNPMVYGGPAGLFQGVQIAIGPDHTYTQLSTVIFFKLDNSFFLNNSRNTHRRKTKPFAMCFYSPVWHFNFFELFALLSTLAYLDGHGAKGKISSGYHLDISEENWVIFWFEITETDNDFTQETPIGNQLFEYHLSTNVGKNETSIGKGHTGDSSLWCGSRSLLDAY